MKKSTIIKNEKPSSTLTERLSLLSRLPFFSLCPNETLLPLAKKMTEVNYASQTPIVIEGDLVDSIFIIMSGNAEVTYQGPESNKKPTLVATLHAGEAIGLTESGLFSSSGLRTATVTAATDLQALRLDIIDFQTFIQTHPQFNFELRHATEILVRTNFIKQAKPFADISPDSLLKLARQVREKHVDNHEVIFTQGDKPDFCYLIRTGQIEIDCTQSNGTKKELAILGPGSLFGEIALLTNTQRNATARALSPCQLLVLRNEDLRNIVKSNRGSAQIFMSMMVNRTRPAQQPDITLHARSMADGEVVTVLKNPKEEAYYQLSDQGLFIWQQLNGENTLEDIAISFNKKFDAFIPEEISDLIFDLSDAGFVYDPATTLFINSQDQPIGMRLLIGIRRIMEAEFAFKNTDGVITRLYQNGGRLFFTKLGQILMATITLLGLIAFMGFADRAEYILSTTEHAWKLLIYLIPVSLLSVFLHELAHALTTKSYGREVHRMGIGWYWIGPMAFADTSDMWLADRKSRVVVNLAGVYADCFVAGTVALFAFFMPNPTLSILMWLFCIFTYFDAFKNLDPTLELDGYYVMMDLFDCPNLRLRAAEWLMGDLYPCVKNPKLFRKFIPEITYWLFTLLFIILIGVFTLLFQKYILANILPTSVHGVSTSYLQWILPVVVVFLSFLTLIADVKKTWQVHSSS